MYGHNQVICIYLYFHWLPWWFHKSSYFYRITKHWVMWNLRTNNTSDTISWVHSHSHLQLIAGLVINLECQDLKWIRQNHLGIIKCPSYPMKLSCQNLIISFISVSKGGFCGLYNYHTFSWRSNAILAISDAWCWLKIGIPEATMYASPIVST